MPPIPPKKKKFFLPNELTFERLPGEMASAYEAFVVYRDMGGRRTVRGAYRIGQNKPEAKAAGGTWITWSKKYKWPQRALLYDEYLDQVKIEAAVKEKERIAKANIRRIEISARAALEENAALAHSNIADVMTWDEEGNVKIKSSSELPPHVTAAISKITHVRSGKQNITTVEMHPKVRPIDLEGQHFNLWDSEKKQQERTATNTFLELLNAMKAGKFDRRPGEPPARITNAPPGIVIETEAALIPEQLDKIKDEI